MKKATFYAVFLFNLFFFSALLGYVYGQGSLKDLGIKSTGLLPSNPFYFMKEWTRNVKRALTFDTLKKIEFDLGTINEKAAELKKLTQLSPNKEELIIESIDGYSYSLDQLLSQMTSSVKDVSKTISVDKFLNRLLDLSLKHAELFQDLANEFSESEALLSKLKDVDAKVINLIITIPQNIEGMEQFRNRFQNVVNAQTHDFKELKAAEVLERMEMKISDPNTKLEINSLKKDLMIRFGVALEKGYLKAEDLNQLPIDPTVRLKILDEVRKSIVNQELKNQLNILRQQTLEQIVSGGKVNSQEAETTINKAKEAVALLKSQVKNSSLLEQAKFYLDQANDFFKQGNYGKAYSQAIFSIGVVEDALLQQQSANGNDNKAEILNIRKEYDRLFNLSKFENLSEPVVREVSGLLEKAEKMIVGADNVKNSNNQAFQEVKILLANIDLILEK